jgi:hypothetical protein
MRYLDHYSGTVTTLVIGSLGSAVLHVLKQRQRLIHQLVRLVSLQIDHHAYSAGIMLVLGII